MTNSSPLCFSLTILSPICHGIRCFREKYWVPVAGSREPQLAGLTQERFLTEAYYKEILEKLASRAAELAIKVRVESEIGSNKDFFVGISSKN